MLLTDLITQCRVEAWDNATPPLFSDSELTQYLNEAQIEACIRKQLIRENTSVVLTQFDILTGVRSYPLDTRMFEIVYADLVPVGSSTSTLRWPLGITTAEELDAVRGSNWRTVPFRPLSAKFSQVRTSPSSVSLRLFGSNFMRLLFTNFQSPSKSGSCSVFIAEVMVSSSTFAGLLRSAQSLLP